MKGIRVARSFTAQLRRILRLAKINGQALA